MFKALTQQTPQWPIRETSKIHSYARTRSFTMTEAEDHAIFREAIEYPSTNQWYIREVTQRPNVRKISDADPDFINDGRIVPSLTNMSLTKALEELAKFERTNLYATFQPTGPDKDEIGPSYFENVALDEDIALDMKGKAHPVINGRVVTEGQFDPNTEDRAMQVFQSGPSGRPKAPVPALTGLFKSAATMDDFDRFIDHYNDINAWKEFHKQVRTLLKLLCASNRVGFDRGMLDSESSPGLYKKFNNGLKAARKNLGNVSFIEAGYQKLLSDYLGQLALAFYIGHAKADYMKIQECDEIKQGKKIQRQLKKHQEKARQICKDLGGSEQDLKTLDAEIVKDESIPLELPCDYPPPHEFGSYRYAIEQKKLNQQGKAFLEKFRKFYGTKFTGTPIRSTANVIYLPEVLLEPLELIEQIGHSREEQAAQDKNRLCDQRSVAKIVRADVDNAVPYSPLPE